MNLKTSSCQARALDPTHRHCLRDFRAVYRYGGQMGGGDEFLDIGGLMKSQGHWKDEGQETNLA